VTKEATNRWKRVAQDGARLVARRNKEKQVLKELYYWQREKLGIDQLTEGVDPLETIKQLVELVISTCANNQVEIHHLRQENRDLKQLHIRVSEKQSGWSGSTNDNNPAYKV
jgi:hypothetical protein